MSLRDKIRAAPDLAPRPLDVPEWNVTVFVRRLTLDERLSLVPLAKDERAATVRTVMAGTLDAEGVPVFAADDEGWLCSEKDGGVLQRIATAILGDAPTVEALEKN